MIDEIQINSPITSYQNPARLSDLRRINYIFGANGTGKTTISRVIAQLQGHDHCQLVWNNGTELEQMMYNRDFVDRNLNQGDPLQDIFTLSENQVEANEAYLRVFRSIFGKAGQIGHYNMMTGTVIETLVTKRRL